MKRFLTFLSRGLLFLIAIAIILINYRPNVPQLGTFAYQLTGHDTGGRLQIQFIGNTNVLVTDGDHTILTDGFFTRPSLIQFLWGEIEPNVDVIKQGLKQAGIEKLDAVIPVHSHFDHAMDSPIVAQMTRAKLVGSESTMNIGRGLGFPEDQMIVAESGVPIEFGSMKVTLIEGKHWPYPDEAMAEKLLNQEITRPIIPPASAMDYKEGASYTIIIEHEEGTMAIHGSAGYIPNILDEYDVDILFLGVAGLETMDDTFNADFQTHVTGALNPELIVPIHWDDFFVPLKRGLKSRGLLEKMLQGMDLETSLKIVEENNPNRKLVVLPLWKTIPVSSL